MEKLLYVDDEDLNLQLFKLNFRSDYQVITVGHPLEALEYLSDLEIKVVVTDYKMPHMNGMQLVEKVKATRPDMVCIMLSGYLESEVVTDKTKLFSYIMKPYRKSDVLEVLSRAFSCHPQASTLV